MDGLSAFSGGVAVWQAAEVAIKTGEQLIAAYKAYKDANKRLNALIIRVESIWIKSTTQIGIVRSLSNRIPQRLQTFQDVSFQRLDELLQKALIKLAKLSGQNLVAGIDLDKLKVEANTWSRLKYSFLESQVEKVVLDLESWHASFDPSWLFLALIQHEDVDSMVNHVKSHGEHEAVTVIEQIRELVQNRQVPKNPSSIFVDASVLSTTRQRLDPTSLELSTLTQTGEQVLLDTTTYPEGSNEKQAMIFVRGLARLLSMPEMGNLSLLRCLGVVQLGANAPDPVTPQFQYIFALPTCDSTPCSLREILARPPPSLDARFAIAKSLAKAITSLHAAKFVHKNIRPETIVVLDDANKEKSIPYLVGFESLRPSEAHSSMVSDMAFERNLYRHPARQGLHPEQYYMMQHDIYSLGVCLLEIGLWTSFIEYGPDGEPKANLPITDLLQMRNKKRAANNIKDLLMNTAKEKLASKMGHTFTEVVVSSLACLDEDSANPFTDSPDVYDEDGIAIGVAFIETILMRLECIAF